MDDYDEVLDYYNPGQRRNLFAGLTLCGLAAALAMLVKARTRNARRSGDIRDKTAGPLRDGAGEVRAPAGPVKHGPYAIFERGDPRPDSTTR